MCELAAGSSITRVKGVRPESSTHRMREDVCSAVQSNSEMRALGWLPGSVLSKTAGNRKSRLLLEAVVSLQSGYSQVFTIKWLQSSGYN